MDRIGLYRGKNISEMTRDELLDFAEYAGKELARLNKMEIATQDHRIKKELFNL